MNRIGLTHPSSLVGKHNQETQSLYQAFSEHADRHLSSPNITWKLPSTGALVGPFGILLHHPHIGRAYLELAEALQEVPTLNPRTKQIIAMVVAVNERVPYQIYASSRLASTQGLTPNELQSLTAGLHASSFTEADKAVYAVARELCVSSGPISDQLWNEAVNLLGRDGAAAVIHQAAFDKFTAAILRGFDAQVPAPGERVEARSPG